MFSLSSGTVIDGSGLTDSGLDQVVTPQIVHETVTFNVIGNETEIVCNEEVPQLLLNFSCPSEFIYWKELTLPKCQFWDKETKSWSTEGCYVDDIRGDEVVCACSHLTDFGVGLHSSLERSVKRIALIKEGTEKRKSDM